MTRESVSNKIPLIGLEGKAKPVSPPSFREIPWLTDRLTSLCIIYETAQAKGESSAGHRFVVATTRLLGLLWLPRVLGARPCVGHRVELAFAWKQFHRRRRELERRGIHATFDPGARVA